MEEQRDEQKIHLGQRLKNARETKRYKQNEAAKIIGVHNSTLAKYESGEREPDFTTLKKMATLYEVSVDWLTGSSDESIDSNSVAENKAVYEKTIPQEERDFLEWVKTAVGEIFFYDFDSAPDEMKKRLMIDLRNAYEREKFMRRDF